MTARTANLCAGLAIILAATSVQAKIISAENGGVTFEVPDYFTALNASEVADCSPDSRTMRAVGDKGRAFVIFWQLTSQSLVPGQLVDVRDDLANSNSVSEPGLKWAKRSTIDLNGTKWFVLEFVNPAKGFPDHTVQIGTSYHGLLFDLYFCIAEKYLADYKPLLLAMLHTVKIHLDTPLPDGIIGGEDLARLQDALEDGFLSGENGDIDEAERQFKAVLAEVPGSPEALYGMGWICDERGDYGHAIPYFSDAIKAGVDGERPLGMRAFAEMQQGDFGSALNDADNVIAKNPRQPAGYNTRGLIESAEGEFAKASADFEKSLALQPHDDNGLRNLAWLKFVQGDDAGAAQELQSLLAWEKVSAAANYDLACVDLQAGKLDAAQKDLQTGLETSPRNSFRLVERAQLLLWIILTRQGGAAAANKGLAAYVKDDSWPKESWCQAVAGYLLGQKSEAEALATEKTNSYEIRDQQNRALFFVGAKHLCEGDPPGAAAAFQKCIACGIPDSEFTVLAKNLR